MTSLKYEFYIGAEPEKVWKLLVEPEGTKKIFFNCVLQSSFKAGEPFRITSYNVCYTKLLRHYWYARIPDFRQYRDANRFGPAYGNFVAIYQLWRQFAT